MFDYMVTEANLPHAFCPTCNNKIIFHGRYYPLEVICGNCGQIINLKESLQKLEFPNNKYDKDGKLIVETTVTLGEK